MMPLALFGSRGNDAELADRKKNRGRPFRQRPRCQAQTSSRENGPRRIKRVRTAIGICADVKIREQNGRHGERDIY
jgi:hypothetical protein